MSIVVDRKDNLYGGKADVVARTEGCSPADARAKWAGPHRGLRAGHAFRGETRELGRALCLLVTTTGRRGVPVDQEPWRWQSASGCQRTGNGTQTEEADKVAGRERQVKRPAKGNGQS